jgi:cytochrome b involved in lipid metabolism
MSKFLYTVVVACLASFLTLWLYLSLAKAAEQPPAESAGIDASLPAITVEELSKHDHAGSCWKAIDGLVYDFTDYIPDHPTRPAVMLRWCGRDSTEAYHTKGYGQPHSPEADAMLPDWLIGRLVDD